MKTTCFQTWTVQLEIKTPSIQRHTQVWHPFFRPCFFSWIGECPGGTGPVVSLLSQHGGPHLAESQAGSGWWRWPVPRRSPRPRGSCRAGTPRREGRTVGRSSRSKAWCTGLCQQAGPSRPQLAWFLPWKPKHPAQQEQQLPSHGSAWAGWRQATPSASTAAKLQHPGTRSTSKFVHGEPLLSGWLCYKLETPLLSKSLQPNHMHCKHHHPSKVWHPNNMY